MNTLLLALWLAFSAPPAAVAPQTPAVAVQAPAEKAHLLERVAVIGASLSEGYGSKTTWQATFEASLTRPMTCVLNKATALTFMSPSRFAVPQAQKALEAKPTLLLAVDYLFWFGYGTQDLDDQPLSSEEARLALLEKGLALLEGFDCPVVLGDFPDMSDAVGVMLMPAQMPAPETLKKLNERLAAWAKTKPNVVVISVSTWVGDLKAAKPIKIGAQTYPVEQTARWLSDDNLHATGEGLAALATHIGFELEARKLLAGSEHTADIATTLERRAQAEAKASAGGAAK